LCTTALKYQRCDGGTEVPDVPKEPTTPSKQRKRPLTQPIGPPTKRTANDNDAALNTINPRSVCDHGSIPIAGPSASYSALLVPFIHAVANKISDVTNNSQLVEAKTKNFFFKYPAI
jgi:hypothetical protein